nr:MAG TPA: hypothetical protein [Caudoviricetes sp.]
MLLLHLVVHAAITLAPCYPTVKTIGTPSQLEEVFI